MTARSMRGVYLPGDRRVDLRKVPVPEPGPGQALLAMRASTVCGSDIRAIYRKHEGSGAEGYREVIAGHEPCGMVAATGPGCRAFKPGDRALVYHISGCGRCEECRRGYQISCTSPERAAYGWQRDGGHADFLLAEERDLIRLPDALSYTDGAQVACGFGTAYEALSRAGASGLDRVLVVGLGPVGLAVATLARAMGAGPVIGVEERHERLGLAQRRRVVDIALRSGAGAVEAVREATAGRGVEVAVDCSGDAAGRLLAIRATRAWGRVVFVGEGGKASFEPSPDLLHKHLTLHGVWVTSLGRMQELVERLARWDVHPDAVLTDALPLEKAAEAYALMDAGTCGKVAIVWDD